MNRDDLVVKLTVALHLNLGDVVQCDIVFSWHLLYLMCNFAVN